MQAEQFRPRYPIPTPQTVVDTSQCPHIVWVMLLKLKEVDIHLPGCRVSIYQFGLSVPFEPNSLDGICLFVGDNIKGKLVSPLDAVKTPLDSFGDRITTETNQFMLFF